MSIINNFHSIEHLLVSNLHLNRKQIRKYGRKLRLFRSHIVHEVLYVAFHCVWVGHETENAWINWFEIQNRFIHLFIWVHYSLVYIWVRSIQIFVCRSVPDKIAFLYPYFFGRSSSTRLGSVHGIVKKIINTQNKLWRTLWVKLKFDVTS